MFLSSNLSNPYGSFRSALSNQELRNIVICVVKVFCVWLFCSRCFVLLTLVNDQKVKKDMYHTIVQNSKKSKTDIRIKVTTKYVHVFVTYIRIVNHSPINQSLVTSFASELTNIFTESIPHNKGSAMDPLPLIYCSYYWEIIFYATCCTS